MVDFLERVPPASPPMMVIRLCLGFDISGGVCRKLQKYSRGKKKKESLTSGVIDIINKNEISRKQKSRVTLKKIGISCQSGAALKLMEDL